MYLSGGGAVMGRCFPFVSEAMDVLQEINDNLAGLDESQVLEQLGKLVQFDQVEYTSYVGVDVNLVSKNKL